MNETRATGPILALCGWVTNHATRIMAAAILVGLAAPPLAAWLRPGVPVYTVLLMVLTATRLDWRMVGAYLRRPWLPLAIVLGLTVALPAAVWAVGRLVLPPDSGLLTGLLLNAAAPTTLSAPAFALFVGGDAALAMAVALAGTTLAPLSVPAVTAALGLEGVRLDPLAMLLRLAALVGGALAGAWLVRRAAGGARLVRWHPYLEAAMVAIIALFGVAIMDGLTATMLDDPGRMLLVLALVFALNVAMQAAGVLALLWRDAEQAVTAGLSGGMRNMGLMLAVVGDAATFEVALVVICAQFPMFVLPLAMRPLFGRLLRAAGSAPPIRPDPAAPGRPSSRRSARSSRSSHPARPRGR